MKRIVTMTAAAVLLGYISAGCATDSSVPSADGEWVTLLDGEDGLEQWNQLGDANWRAEDGAVMADAKTGTPAGFLVSPRAYDNFELQVEFWASDDANSGIYMRCADPQKMSDVTCYEANIFDQRPEAAYGTGAIVHHAAVDPMPKAGGKWNTMDIVADGPRLTVKLDGVQTATASDSSLASGPIALQYAAGVVKFRKVRIREIGEQQK